jgi:general secretion pathway protein L
MKANVKSFMEKSGTLKNTGSLTGKNDLKIVEIIGELSGKIDDSTDMDISRFLFNKGRLVLSGSTDNFNSVDKIKSKIESSQIFKAVNISSAAADKKGNRVKFKFIIEM